MRLNQLAGNKGDRVAVNGMNVETSTIVRGTPVVLRASATDAGLAVVLPSTAGAAKTQALAFGVATDAFVTNTFQDLIAFGYCPYILMNRATRAASTDSWTSSASVASFAILSIDTINNAFAVLSVSAATNMSALPFAVLIDSIASFAASASATSDSRTVMTSGPRAFIRML